MKYLTTILLFLIGISANSQTFSVKGIQKYCETDRTDNRERYLSVLQNDSVIVENVKTRFGEFKVNGLNEGLYTFKFTNIFGQSIKKEIEIFENQKLIIICVDEFQDTNHKTLFEIIEINDKITIDYSSSGCEHFDKERMEFFYQKGNLIGELYIGRDFKKRKKLNTESIENLICFEKKIKEMNNSMGGCTTTDQFVFQLNGKNRFTVKDDSCDWNGYYQLKKDIFNYKK